MTHHPADLCGLEGKGRLAENGDADLTIIDPDQQWIIDVDTFRSRSRNCPFDGRTVTARAVATMVGGSFKLNRDRDRLAGTDEGDRPGR